MGTHVPAERLRKRADIIIFSIGRQQQMSVTPVFQNYFVFVGSEAAPAEMQRRRQKKTFFFENCKKIADHYFLRFFQFIVLDE